MTRAQWAILAGAVALFALAMLALTQGEDGGDDAGEFDEIVWCRAAAAVSGRAGVLDPAFGGDPAVELDNLIVELQAAVVVAPEAVQPDLARALDLARLTRGQVDAGTPWPDALIAARSNTDQPRLDAALAGLSTALETCGHAPLPADAISAGGSDPR